MKTEIELTKPEPNCPMIVYNVCEECYLLVCKERGRIGLPDHFSACYLTGEKAGEPYGEVCKLHDDELYSILPIGTILTLIQE